MNLYRKKFSKLFIGLILYAVGLYFGIQANVGLAPWDAFSMGISNKTGMLYGDVAVWTGVVLVVIDVFLGEKIGFGTVFNGILVGKLVDLFLWWDLFPKLENFFAGVLMLLCGQIIICLATYFYIDAGMGSGPRDSFMVAMGKLLPKVPIGLIRGMIEGTVLLIGWLLGAKVGVGTVIAVFGISTLMEYTFRILNFDVKAVKHETFTDTIRGLRQAIKNR